MHLAHLEPPLIAHCDVERGQIIVHIGLTMAEKKEALAHEIGHLRLGHTCSTTANETRADRFAAGMLVDLDAYRRAEHIDPDPQAIADALGVTRRIVRVFQKQLLPTLALRRGA